MSPTVKSLLMLALVGGLTFTGIAGCKTRAAPAAQVKLTTTVIPVDGMSCVSCVASVKKTLSSMPGVGEVEVNLAERSARVSFDSTRVSPQQFVTAIDNLGYHAGTPKQAQP